MSTLPYLKPPWMQRNVANRLVPLVRPSLISKLSVRGRHSGRWHTVPVAVLEYDGERYLVSYRGESDWARNLRSVGAGRLSSKGHVEDIAVTEVPINQRAQLLQAYRARYAAMPTVSNVLEALPEPADHPTFKITAASPVTK